MICKVMGVLNVTPDSFYDGGRYLDHEAAIRRGFEMIDQGADLIDVGGESSRPGADPVDAAEECNRVLPVIAALAGSTRVSVDTSKPEVARAAVAAGATLLNDISSTLGPVAAETGAGIVLMHMAGTPKTMQKAPQYGDVVAEVAAYLAAVATKTADLGVKEIYVDPGIGFGKRLHDNLALLRALPLLVDQGVPVLVGTSRKTTLGEISVPASSPRLGPDDRFEASLASAIWSMACGAAMVRVHDVKATVMGAKLVGDVGASNSVAAKPGSVN